MTRHSGGVAAAPAAERQASAEERRLVAVGVSHNTASVELRERLALPGHRKEQLLRALREEDGIDEGVALFTCNRTELYVAAADAAAAPNAVLQRLALRPGGPPRTLDRGRHVPRDAQAPR